MRIQCRTLFDCSYTGTTGHFRPGEIPFEDRIGQKITNQADWHHSRNQQRNWETLLQIIGLRTQPLDITTPVYRTGAWEFEFRVESPSVYAIDGHPDPLAGLVQGCEDVPMMTNLTEQPELKSTITTVGSDQNIWFLPLNTSLERSW